METEDRIKALAKYLECEEGDLDTVKYDDQVVGFGKQEYLVVDDDEADKIWDDRLESYIEECILPELPEHLRFYFDDENWKEDAKGDGRGHSISTYDGNEDEVDLDGETIYIFRLN